MKYIDADKLKAEIERMRKINRNAFEADHIKSDVFHGRAQAINHLSEFIVSLQQEQPDVNLENKLEWHNVSEETPEFGDTIIVACKNKNKEDGIWLYDLIHCWEGKWEPRENWETPLKWISVDELGLNARKEE